LENIEDEIKKLYEQQSKILEKLGEMSNKIDEHGKALEDNKRELSSLHGEIQGVRQELEDHKKGMSSLQSEVQGVRQILEDHKNKLENINRNLKDHTKILEDHTQRFTNVEGKLQTIEKSIVGLERVIGTYTSMSDHEFEKTMMELYKEALEIHGVDPNKVKHGKIIDERGVTGHKGLEYKVDFYEVTDSEVYVFEVKTYGDKGAVEQLLDRKLLFESQGKKVTKMFLVCHVIDEQDKKFTEQYGVIVITGEVKRKLK